MSSRRVAAKPREANSSSAAVRMASRRSAAFSARVAAGMHFMTDVAAGALLGTAIGYAVPLLHRDGNDGLNLSAFPDAVLVTWRY